MTRALRGLAARLPLWPTLAAVSAIVLLVQVPGRHATAWHFFEDAANLLIGRGPDGSAGGLRLYRDHPEFQFGPLSVVAAVPFTLLGPTVGPWAAMIVASAAGLVAFALVLQTIDRLLPGLVRSMPPEVVLAAGLVVVITWGDVAVRTAHIDDAIVLLALAAALRSCAGDHGRSALVWLTIAAAAKPWAVMFAPLAFVPAGRRALRFVLVGGVAALTWVPFILVEPGTLDTTDFVIVNDATSVLRALGVDDPVTPSWARYVQLAGGMVVVAALVATHRWPAALMAGVAWRLLFEPGAHRYYTIGLVLGAVLVELLRRPQRLPLGTVAAAIVLEVTAWPDMPAVPGRYLRLACVAAVLAAAAASRPTTQQATGTDPPDRPGGERVSAGRTGPGS